MEFDTEDQVLSVCAFRLKKYSTHYFREIGTSGRCYIQSLQEHYIWPNILNSIYFFSKARERTKMINHWGGKDSVGRSGGASKAPPKKSMMERAETNLDSYLGNWARFWDSKIWWNWGYSSPCCTKTAITFSIVKLQDCFFAYKPDLTKRKYHILGARS